MIKLLQSEIESIRKSMQEHIPIYRNGYIVKIIDTNDDIYNNRQYAYDANEFISDGVLYNINDINSIRNIKIPQFGDGEITNNLAYILKMQACKEKDSDKALYMCYKAASLMMNSKIDWQRKDYMRIVEQLWKVGEIKYADELEIMMNEKLPLIFNECEFYKKKLKEAIKTAEELNTDLLEATKHFGTCCECAKLQNRIYSISGHNKKFPKLPKEVFDYGNFHKGCHHIFYPFHYYKGVKQSQYTSDGKSFVLVDAIKNSNRPYVDDRSSEEKEKYNQFSLKRKNDIDFEQLKREYYHKKYYEPASVPKSFSAYMKEKDFKHIV